MIVEGAEDFAYMIMLPTLVLLLGWCVVFTYAGLILPVNWMVKTQIDIYTLPCVQQMAMATFYKKHRELSSVLCDDREG